MRTLGAVEGTEEVREVECSTVAAIARAEKLIYIENQYITARCAAEALLERMRAKRELEVLILTNEDPGGWLEAETMGVGRQYFMATFADADLKGRIHFLYPFVQGSGTECAPIAKDDGHVQINVHAKVIIVDDVFLRVGSSNLNNRSMGFDTECDLGVEAETEAHRSAIADVRNRLIAEHWGTDAETVAEALASGKPVLEAMQGVGDGVRDVAPLEYDENAAGTEIVLELGDPESPVTAERFVDDILGLKRRRPAIRWALGLLGLGAVVAALVAVWNLLPFDGAAVVERVGISIESLRGNPWRIPLVLIAFVVGGVVAFPILVLIPATIIALGPLQGFICAVIGTMLGASASFGTGRLIGKRPLRNLFGDKMRRFERELDGRGVVAVALIRKVPVAPFTIVNMAVGASGIPFREFLAGTALGMIPGIAAFALVGDRLVDVWQNPTPLNLTLVAAAAALWIGVVLGTQRLINRFRKR
jgi:uncharacterized membrane protein YdjX (TVP38/TMEM64 family)